MMETNVSALYETILRCFKDVRGEINKEIYLDSKLLWHVVKLVNVCVLCLEIGSSRKIVKLTANNWSSL